MTRALTRSTAPSLPFTEASAPVLIVGGAGFIGCNLAAHLARAGARIRLYDDLSRPGVAHNLAWLRGAHGDQIEVCIEDVRDGAALREAVVGVQAVFHLAAQVAVATSVISPRHDFEVNAGGTLELLEALRALPTPPPLVFTSTSKVYGSLPDVPLQLEGQRWWPADPALQRSGIDEQRPLAFRTPYGCSKGAADQYVLDYAHSFGLPATVLRLSSIFGPHQLGTEDQSWVARVLVRALDGAPVTIHGDGRQVRDVLYVDDLVDALIRAWSQIDQVRGRAFNVGGGPASTLSLLELLDLVTHLRGQPPATRLEDWREGAQRYYVSDPRAFMATTGWRPRVLPRTGIEALHGWLLDSRAPARA